MGNPVTLEFDNGIVHEMRGNVFSIYFTHDILWQVAQNSPEILDWFRRECKIQTEQQLKDSVMGLPKNVLGLPYPNAYVNWIEEHGNDVQRAVSDIVGVDEILTIDASLLERIFDEIRTKHPRWDSMPAVGELPVTGNVKISWEE